MTLFAPKRCRPWFFLRIGLITTTVAAACLPQEDCPAPIPIESPQPGRFGFFLQGFESPYIGKTGSWNGAGRNMNGKSKAEAMDLEVSMGLQWTFMSLYWSALEPNGPVDLDTELPKRWVDVDNFVVEAQSRGLNILMQAPVVGGNAGGPPQWAGRRNSNSAAPKDMQSLVDFAAKLVRRYMPGGTLAQEKGWESYGVRAWELDNEPDSYRTHWGATADDYAEFVTLTSQAIKAIDPLAVILTPAVAGGTAGVKFTSDVLDAETNRASKAYRDAGVQYAIGPFTDVVSFHNYELLEWLYAGGPRSLQCDFSDIRRVFESFESQLGHEFSRKTEYWHTEGGYDFLGFSSGTKKSRWVVQYLARGFAAGIRKITLMDSWDVPGQARSVRTFVSVLPDPFPMRFVNQNLGISEDKAKIYRVERSSDGGWTYIAWAANGAGDQKVSLPIRSATATRVSIANKRGARYATSGMIKLKLKGGSPFSEPVFLLEELR